MLIKCPRCCFQLTVYLRYYHESTCSINRALFYIMSFMISVVIIWNWLNTSRVSIYSLLLSGFSHITSLSTDCSTEENIEILINFVQNSWKSHYLNFWDELLSENSSWENFEYQQWGFFAMKRRLFVTKGWYDDARNTLSRVEEERKDGVFFFLLRSMIDMQRISILRARNSSIFFSAGKILRGGSLKSSQLTCALNFCWKKIKKWMNK